MEDQRVSIATAIALLLLLFFTSSAITVIPTNIHEITLP
jgi:hypothetical protein